MSVEANKAAVRRYLMEDASAAAPSLRYIDVLDEVADPDLTVVFPGYPTTHGRENVKKLGAPYFGALSDRRVTVEEMVGEGDRVAVRWTTHATFKAHLPLPLPGGMTVPAGKTLTWASLGLFRVREGKVVEERTHMDWLAALQQLGVVPAATS